VWFINRREQRKKLKQNHQRRGEGTHQGKPIPGTNQHVEERYRPSDENDDLKEVRDRTTAERVTADRQERRLKNKAESDGEKFEPHRPKNPTAHFEGRVPNRHEKTDR